MQARITRAVNLTALPGSIVEVTPEQFEALKRAGAAEPANAAKAGAAKAPAKKDKDQMR